MVHGCMVDTERAETAAVSRGTSHVTIKQRCKYTTSVDVQTTTTTTTTTTTKTQYNKLVIHVESHASAVSVPEGGE